MAYALVLLLAMMCTLVPFWMGQSYGLLRLVSPMHVLSYFCALGFFIKVAVFGYQPDYAFYQRYIETPGALARGALYLSGFVCAVCLGYRLAVRPMPRSSHAQQFRAIAAGINGTDFLFVVAIGVAAATIAGILSARDVSLFAPDLFERLNEDKQINVNAEGVGATLAGMKTFFVIPKFALILILAKCITRPNLWLFVQFAALCGLLVLIALMSGDRFELVELLVYCVATFVILGGRLGPRSFVLAACAATGVLLLSAYMTALRGSDAGLLRQVVGSTYFLDINASVMVTDRVAPEMLLWGQSYGWWSFGWVPRSIWIDKPAIDLGVFLKRDVMGIATGGAFNVTGPGEAFMNFGWFGMFVGVALGWFYRVAEVALLSARYALRYGTFLLYPILFYPFIQATLQSSFSAFIVGAAAQFVLIAVMIKLFVPRFRVRMRITQGGRGHAYA